MAKDNRGRGRIEEIGQKRTARLRVMTAVNEVSVCWINRIRLLTERSALTFRAHRHWLAGSPPNVIRAEQAFSVNSISSRTDDWSWVHPLTSDKTFECFCQNYKNIAKRMIKKKNKATTANEISRERKSTGKTYFNWRPKTNQCGWTVFLHNLLKVGRTRTRQGKKKELSNPRQWFWAMGSADGELIGVLAECLEVVDLLLNTAKGWYVNKYKQEVTITQTRPGRVYIFASIFAAQDGKLIDSTSVESIVGSIFRVIKIIDRSSIHRHFLSHGCYHRFHCDLLQT